MAELRTIIGSPTVEPEQEPFWAGDPKAMYTMAAAPSGGVSFTAASLGLTK